MPADVATEPREVFVIEVVPAWRPGRGRYFKAAGAGYTDSLEHAGLWVIGDDGQMWTPGGTGPHYPRETEKYQAVPIEPITKRLVARVRAASRATPVDDFETQDEEASDAR